MKQNVIGSKKRGQIQKKNNNKKKSLFRKLAMLSQNKVEIFTASYAYCPYYSSYKRTTLTVDKRVVSRIWHYVFNN